MKKHMIMLAACCGMAFASQAQDAMSTGTSTGDFKANGGDVTIEANLNLFNGATSNIGLSNGIEQLRLRYFLNDDLALRLGMGVNRTSNSAIYTDPDLTNGLVETSSSTWSFSPGIEKHFAGTDRLSPYVGAELIFMGESTEETTTGKTTDTEEDYSLEVSGGTETSRDQSGFGLNAVAGADWYVTRRLYLGFEVGFGFMRNKDKDFERVEKIGSESDTFKSDGENKDTNFGPNVRNSIRIGFAF